MQLVFAELMCTFVSVCMHYGRKLGIVLTEIRAEHSGPGRGWGFLTATHEVGGIADCSLGLGCSVWCIPPHPTPATPVQALHLLSCRGLNKSFNNPELCILIWKVKVFYLGGKITACKNIHKVPALLSLPRKHSASRGASLRVLWEQMKVIFRKLESWKQIQSLCSVTIPIICSSK